MTRAIKIILVLSVFVFAPQAQAIVVLPAIILIPLVKIIAVVIAAFSVPVTSIGVFLAKITKNRRLSLQITVLIAVLLIVISAILLRVLYPNNPWF